MELESLLDKLTKDIESPSGREKPMIDWICGWLQERGIDYESDPDWGMLFKVPYGNQPEDTNGILLVAHLDRQEAKPFDDTTGIAVILKVLDDINDMKLDPDLTGFNVHIYFSVMEEVGQRGGMVFPIEKLFGRVRYGIAVDRRSSYFHDHSGNRRHIVTRYCGVDTILPEELDIFQYEKHRCSSNRCAINPGNHGTHYGVVGLFRVRENDIETDSSPNCSDVIELRGRWDMEYVAPYVQSELDLKGLLEEYHKKTEEIIEDWRNNCVRLHNQPPRTDRYRLMRDMYERLYCGGLHSIPAYNETMKFSVVNLSMEYSEVNKTRTLQEMEETVAILKRLFETWSIVRTSTETKLKKTTSKR